MDSKTMANAFIVAFDDDKRDIYTKHIRPEMTYAQKDDVIESHYKSKARSLQILTSIESLYFPTFKERHNTDDEQRALPKLVDHINTHTIELDERHDNDSARLGHLRRATKHMPWAGAPLRNFSTAKYSYHQYILAL